MTTEWDVGDAVILSIDFENAVGAATNPTTVVLTVKKPNGTLTTPAFTNPSTGHYESVIAIDQAGTWKYRWTGTGVLNKARESLFTVRYSMVLP